MENPDPQKSKVTIRAAVICTTNEDKIVLVSTKNPTIFQLPGGKAEQENGSLAATAEREFVEETGLLCKVEYSLGEFPHKNKLTTVFKAKFLKEEPSKLKEVGRGVKYVSLDEAKESLKVARQDQIPYIDAYIKYRSRDVVSELVEDQTNRNSRLSFADLEAYVLKGAATSEVSPQRMIGIQMETSGPQWIAPNLNRDALRLKLWRPSPERRTLIRISPTSAIGCCVDRMREDFDWIRKRLEHKFSFSILPRHEEDGPSTRIANRELARLQAWVDIVCNHPVMSDCDLWTRFITTPAPSQDWASYKEQAEADPFVGGNVFALIKAPPERVPCFDVEKRVKSLSQKVMLLSDLIKQAIDVLDANAAILSGPFRDGFIKFGSLMTSIGSVVPTEAGSDDAAPVITGLKVASEKYDAVGKQCAEKALLDREREIDELAFCRNLLASTSRILDAQKLLSLRNQQFQMAKSGMMSTMEWESRRTRIRTVSCALLAEIKHCEEEVNRGLIIRIKNVLSNQILFHQNITNGLQETLNKF